MSTIKVKQTGGGSEYLETIPSIQLNQGFQQSLQAAVNKINENFKKIISLPFLQGDHGNSIFETTIAIGEGTVGNKLKTAICQSIYGTDTPDDTQFGGNYFGSSWGDASQGDLTYDGTQIVFYRHKETDEQSDKYFYTAREFFLFIDKRIENLRSADLSQDSLMSAITSFQDLSCAITVFGKADALPSTGQPDFDNITFEVKKHSIVPTLYYDSTCRYWCWAVNGVKTGVIAQGVKGDTGSSRKIYVCVGEKDPAIQQEHTVIRITNVMQPEEYKNLTALQFAELVNVGDLLVVWFKDEEGTGSLWSTLDNCTFGTAKKHLVTDTQTGQVVDGYAYIDNGTTAGNRMDLATIMAETSLYRWLNDICNDEAVLQGPNINPAIRGLYIPNGKPFEANLVHMWWSDLDTGSNPVASIGCVDYAARQLNGGARLPSISGDNVTSWSSSDKSTLNIWYPTVRCHRGTFYRLMKNYTMVSGIDPTNLSNQALKNYSDPGINPGTLNLARTPGEIASAISLKGPKSGSAEEETVIASSGLYIKRKNDRVNLNDIPSVYIDHGMHGKIYVKGGRITTQDARILIGRTQNQWRDPKTYFSSKYDGSDTSNSDGGSYSQLIENSIRTDRWDFSIVADGTPNYMDNPGVKLVSSDIVNHGGMIIVSSDNAYKNVFIKDNKLMFDYKVHAEIGTASQGSLDNSTVVHDRRPRYKEYIGIQIGGYNTIYNSITSNGSAGKINTVLDDLRDPISLTPDQNKEYALLSGKSGYTAMIENWGPQRVRYTDAPYTFDDDEGTITIDPAENWGMITSYDCLWTKVGNVVDVKGKIFLSQAKYNVNSDNITVDVTSSRPLTYAEVFRHIKRYGSNWAFPLPVVINAGTKTSPVYKVSTGNAFDNPENWPIVNLAKAQSDTQKVPFFDKESANIYHNDIFNGSVQFHFYGTSEEETLYSVPKLDGGNMNLTSIGKKMNNRVDMLNNVFSVTADIAKSDTYDNRYWCISGIPNYDAINFSGSVGSGDTKLNDDSLPTQKKIEQKYYNNSSAGPIRIVSTESTARDHGRYRESVTPTYSQKYQYVGNILGLQGEPNTNFEDSALASTWLGRVPTYIGNMQANSGHINTVTPIHSLANTTPEHLGLWLQNNLINNYAKYKISVNIGSYFVRYLTFSFSYLLDDDVQEAYQGNDRAGHIASADQDKWVIPSNVDGHRVTGWENRIMSAEVPAYDSEDR